MAVLSLPPARGALSVMFLALTPIGLMLDADIGILGRVGFSLGMLLLATPIWAWTLSGFWNDISLPDHDGRSVVLAARPRRLALALSWIALVMVILGAPAVTIATRSDVPDQVGAAGMLGVLIGLPIASLLPGISRWYVTRGGTVSVQGPGLIVRSPRHETARVRLEHLADLDQDRRVADALPGRAGRGLARGVRWRNGAREAVARWVVDGFDPSLQEVRALGLRGEWSSDPRACAETWRDKAAVIAFLGWAVLLLGLLATGIAVAVGRGDAPWWILLALGWAPVLGLAVLVPRLLRAVRHSAQPSRPPARVTQEGWVDLLHQQGLVRWEHIEHLMVRGRDVLLVATEDAPPFRDPDIGNRLNERFEDWAERSRIRVPSAGSGIGVPGLEGVSERHLSYPPKSHASAVADDAEALGAIPVHRVRPVH